MTEPTLIVQRHYIDWPLNQPLTDQALIHEFGIQASSGQRNLNDKVTFNLTQVNTNQQGEYPVSVTVMDSNGQTATDRLTIHVVPKRTAAGSQTASNYNQSGKKSYKGLWIALVVVVVILLAWWGITTHNRNQAQEANNEAQSSQINDNSSSINKLSSDNQKLAQQVAALKGAAKQYEKDHDQAALQQRLTEISNQNQQIVDQLHSNSAKEKLTDINQTITQVQQDPSNATATVNDLKNKDGFDQLWSSITSQVQGWLQKYQNSSNN